MVHLHEAKLADVLEAMREECGEGDPDAGFRDERSFDGENDDEVFDPDEWPAAGYGGDREPTPRY